MQQEQETITRGLSYPLYVTPPKEIDITIEEFNKLSYFGVASFWIANMLAVHEVGDDEKTLKVYLSDRLFWTIRNNKKYDGIEMGYYRNAEFGYVNLKPGMPHYDYIMKKRHLFFKK